MTPQHHTLVTKLKVNQALNIGKTDIPVLNFLINLIVYIQYLWHLKKKMKIEIMKKFQEN